MLKIVVQNARGTLTLALIFINTVACFIPILLGSIVRLVLPIPAVRDLLARFLIGSAEFWITINKVILKIFTPFDVKLTGDQDFARRDWYLVIANHQTWVDVMALQFAFNRRVPFFKFFIKQQLIWVPFLGIAWWALDMPFMKRYSKSYLARHPEKRGQDMATTRKACEKFKTIPTSVINFVEGTRSTPAKIESRGGKYEYLLRPRSGGVAFALDAMGSTLNKLLDLTVFYPGKQIRFWDLCCGRIGTIVIDVKIHPIPEWVFGANYGEDQQFRQRFHQWLDVIWQEKDRKLKDLHSESSVAT